MNVTVSECLELIDVPIFFVAGGRVSFANSAAQSLLGRHILGQDFRIAIRHPASVDLINSGGGGRVAVDSLSDTHSSWQMTCSVLNDGTKLITLEDLSLRERVARAHSDFVANASHELRTPLAAIIGYVETLADPKAGNDVTTRQRFLGIIRREAQRMQALVEDLMSLSRIETGKLEDPHERVDLVALTHQVAAEFAGGGTVTVDSTASTVFTPGDNQQLAQVMRNLIDNGLKYGKPGGPVKVTLEPTQNGWISISVHDDGDEIAPEHLPRLTERFYRANPSRSREIGGTGLGLSIVKHIVERHRGTFNIISKVGRGTTASLLLRLADPVVS